MEMGSLESTAEARAEARANGMAAGKSLQGNDGRRAKGRGRGPSLPRVLV